LTLPETGSGWLLWCVLWAVQAGAVAVIVRNVRGRTVNGWDVTAFLFVVLAGPGAALLFLLVHDVRVSRASRHARGGAGLR